MEKNTIITFNIFRFHYIEYSKEFSIFERNIYINKNKNILLDNDTFVNDQNALYPI